jgi:hypothetical protein
MKYFETVKIGNFTGHELKKASDILKKNYPNGPKVKRMETEKYSFNEIANHIRNSYQEVSKSLHA